MNRDEIAILLKAKLAEDLEKQGSSLLEFEDILTKEANTGIPGILGSLGEMGMATALLGGTTLGGLGYAINKHLDNQDKALGEKRQEVDRYKQLTNRVKTDYDLI